MLTGPNKGQRHTGGFAFIYRVNENEWSEVWGFLPGNKQGPFSATWTREKKNTVSDVELLDEVVATFTDGYNQHDAEALSQLYSVIPIFALVIFLYLSSHSYLLTFR